MAGKAHRSVRASKSRPRKFNGKCEHCGKSICICKAYQYVDESNQAITDNSPYLCRECYESKYNTHIKTDAEAFKSRIINRLERAAEYMTEDENKVLQRVISYISGVNP